MRLVVAVIFLVAACGGTADRPTQSAGTEAPVNTEAPASSASTTWEEFQDHVHDSAHEAASIASGLGGVDPSTLEPQILKLQTWVESETKWLDAHSADPCYAGTYTPWSRSVTFYGQTASLYREAIAERDVTKIRQANEAKGQGDKELQKVVDSIPTSETACA